MNEECISAIGADVNGNSFPSLQYCGNRATITLCRPAEHNRIDPADVSVLNDYFQDVLKRSSVRVLIITGSGQKTFCSGYTIDAIRDSLDDGFERMLDTLESLPLPVICALNGSAYGGGTDLALCCDFRIGVRGSRIFMPAAKFGLHYYPGGLRRYVTRLGVGAAKKLFLTAQAIDADEMLRVGFLTELAERADLGRVIESYVNALDECEPGVVASMKRDLDLVVCGRGDESAQRSAYLASLGSQELAQRLAARSTGK